MRVIALVPARGGSKGVPGKNLAEVGGRTLVERAITCARLATSIVDCYVSSDDDRILDHAADCGATPVRRRDDLARDETTSIDVVRDFVKSMSMSSRDALVLLQPTSPFRAPSDIDECASHLADGRSATTVCLNEHPVDWMFLLDDSRRLVARTAERSSRRQEAPELYRLAGSVYTVPVRNILDGAGFIDDDTVGVVVPRHRAIDIDDQFDLAIARALADGPYDPLGST